MQLNELTADHFRPYIQQVFTIRYEPDQALDVALVSVTALGPEPQPGQPPQRRQAFSLIFQGPMSPILRQSIYAIDHHTLGTLKIFIVPVGPDSEQKGMRYEAIFN